MSKIVGGAPPARGGSGKRISRDRARQHYASIVESSDDAIISKDLDGVIMSWNRGAQRLFGYSAEEAVGRSVTILIPIDRQDEEPMILERVRRGERIDHYETIRQRKDGSLVDISLTVSPIKNQKGEIVGASKIARDITETKRAQERQELLLREMDHRVKNLFALANSVLSLSGRSAGSVPELIKSAGARLSALARAHSLTLSHGPGDAPQSAKPTTLHSLIEAIAAPYNLPSFLTAHGPGKGQSQENRRVAAVELCPSTGQALPRHGKLDNDAFGLPIPRDVSPKLACHGGANEKIAKSFIVSRGSDRRASVL